MLKDRKPLLFIASGALAALAGGAFLGYWLSERQEISTSLPAGAEVISQDALLAVTVPTEAMQWRRLRALGTPQSRAVLDKTLVDWRDRFLGENGYNFSRDIQPWVGREVTVALFAPTPTAADIPDPQPEQGPSSAPEAKQPFVAVFPIANPEVAQQTLTQPKTSANQQVQERNYQGFKLWEIDGEGDRDYTATVLDSKFLVMATTPKLAEQTIDAYRGKKTLSANSDYRDAFAATTAVEPFLRLYINAPQAKAVVTSNDLQPIPILPLTPLQSNQGIAATVSITEDGLQIQGANWLPKDSQTRYSVSNNAGRIPSLLPASTLIMASGNNLQEFWQRYSQNATAPPANPLNPNTFQEGVRSLTGLDLNQDLLSWMTGDFSLSLMPLPTPTASLQTGMLLTVKTSDRTTAEETLKRLDEVMRSRYQFQVTPAQVKGQPVVNWISPFGSLSFTHGWLDDRTAFLALGPSIAGAILPKPDTALAQTTAFQLRGESGSANNGQFFVNLEKLLVANPPIPLPQLPADGDALLRSIRNISLAAAIRNPHSTRFDIYVQMKQEGSPQALPGF